MSEPRLTDLNGFRFEVDHAGQRGDIILDRPSFNVIMMPQRDQLRRAFETLDEDVGMRVIVLRAVGEHLSSGGYIKGFLEASRALLCQGFFSCHRQYRVYSQGAKTPMVPLGRGKDRASPCDSVRNPGSGARPAARSSDPRAAAVLREGPDRPARRPDQSGGGSSRKYGSTGPVSFIVSGAPCRSTVLPTATRTQPSLTQYSSTLVFSTPLKRMPTPRSSRAAS